ncbi:calpain-A-like [Aphidius gifuensis]|uniref:calpain-A-like n=1 Tax=Aphidius gifuensis TaxID=684658 RepID=UPI001CDC36D7|nr:calpain-A-like [Aphidius gifuensis]
MKSDNVILSTGSYCEEFNAKLCQDLVLMEKFKRHASAFYFSVAFEKLRKLLDDIDYELTYDIIATIFHTHGNDVDIFYHQFVQAVVDVTLIFDKIQNTPAVIVVQWVIVLPSGRFWEGGTWVDVVVDDRLPTQNGKLIYASSGYPNEFWPSLMEKAYAKLLYRSYKKLNAGFASIAMQDLSGGISERFFVENSASHLFKTMQNTIKKSTMIACGSYSKKQMTARVGINTFAINPNHAYAITDIKIATKNNVDGEIKLIRICNPHGVVSLNPYPGKISEIFPKETIESELKIEVDGESWILYEDFIKYFDSVYICNLTPNRLIGDIYSIKSGNKLSLSAIKGKWMGGIESREVIKNDFLKINPQYRMVLKESNEGDECNILIGLSLKSRHDSVPVDDVPISLKIIIYDDHDKYTLTKPLLDYSKEYRRFCLNGKRGQESGRFDLKPGTYYIIPFMKDTFKAATFFLQILSEQRDILEVYDRNIDVPNVKDKESFELYQPPGCPGYIHIPFIIIVLKRNGFSMNNDLLKRTVSRNAGEKNLIHFNGLSLIVFTLKSQFEKIEMMTLNQESINFDEVAHDMFHQACKKI